jgi:hypothetical protein
MSARYRSKMYCGEMFIVDTKQKVRCFDWQDSKRVWSEKIAKVLATKKLSHKEVAKLICSALNKQNRI